MKPKITFPYWGNYTFLFENLLSRMGFDCIPPEETNQASISEGSKLSPDLFCFPFKVNVGNYLAAIKKGADTILMWENTGGSCRLRYYWIVQEKILREAGHDIRVVNLSFKNFFPKLKELSGNKISNFRILKSVYYFFRELRLIEDMENKANYFRARAKNKGETEKFLNEAFARMKKAENTGELAAIKKETLDRFSKIERSVNQDVLKIGIIGEIYAVCDGKANFELNRKLGEMGAETHRRLGLSQHLTGGFFWNEKLLQMKVDPYLKTTVGGHGRQAVAEMMDFTKEGYDGVIQLLPFGCMPEVSVRPILEKISRDKKIPFLSISLDEQTAEAGLLTRLEAFCDLLWSRRRAKNNYPSS